MAIVDDEAIQSVARSLRNAGYRMGGEIVVRLAFRAPITAGQRIAVLTEVEVKASELAGGEANGEEDEPCPVWRRRGHSENA